MMTTPKDTATPSPPPTPHVLAETQAERDLLADYEKIHGAAWVQARAHLVLTEARALGFG